MNRQDDRELDQILMQRGVPDMRSNLEARIIEAAKKSQQKRDLYMRAESLGISAWVNDFMKEFIMPKPALAACLVLVLGIAMGVIIQDYSGTSEEDMIYVYVQNSFEIEDWL